MFGGLERPDRAHRILLAFTFDGDGQSLARKPVQFLFGLGSERSFTLAEQQLEMHVDYPGPIGVVQFQTQRVVTQQKGQGGQA